MAAPDATREESPPVDEEINSVPYYTTFAARRMTQPRWNEYRNQMPRIVQVTPHGVQRKTVQWVAWSCDGKRLASCGYEKSVRLWNPEKSTEVRSTASLSGGHTEHIDQVAWSPVHKDLLCSSSSGDRRVCFWDARQSKVIQNIRLDGSPWQIAYSPDGKSLLTVGNDGGRTFCLFQHSKDGKDSWTKLEAPKHNLETEASCFDSRSWIFAGSILELHWVLDVQMALSESSITQHSKTYTFRRAITGNRSYVVTGGNDAILGMWDMQEWICVRTCSPYDETVNWLRFSHDGEWIASVVAKQKEITLVNFETGEVGHRIKMSGEVNCLAWHPSKLLLASCGDEDDKNNVGWVSFFNPPA
ncbi:related to THO complex subunit 3 [Serendipita indica DSM 11827]|uniref:Related to THO complex subunit 3 n=1 Tax=Serendipita indica (strain DSM 11827) TaxID=1109443 RepID=G4TVH9_SERID|nr:related to THO complex subunit 3 [Serendipita indica DSM 11827]